MMSCKGITVACLLSSIIVYLSKPVWPVMFVDFTPGQKWPSVRNKLCQNKTLMALCRDEVACLEEISVLLVAVSNVLSCHSSVWYSSVVALSVQAGRLAAALLHYCEACLREIQDDNITCLQNKTLNVSTHTHTHTHTHTLYIYRCPRRNVKNFGRVFLMLNYTDTTQNTYIQSCTVTEIMAKEVWNVESCYSLIDYQIHIETGRNMWFL
jgi:hypothetical protein